LLFCIFDQLTITEFGASCCSFRQYLSETLKTGSQSH